MFSLISPVPEVIIPILFLNTTQLFISNHLIQICPKFAFLKSYTKVIFLKIRKYNFGFFFTSSLLLDNKAIMHSPVSNAAKIVGKSDF